MCQLLLTPNACVCVPVLCARVVCHPSNGEQSAAFLEEFDAKMPFQMDEFDPGHSQHIAPWLAMVVAFVCAIGLMFWVVRSSARTWDYATTLSIIHWVVSMCGESTPARCQHAACAQRVDLWWVLTIRSLTLAPAYHSTSAQ